MRLTHRAADVYFFLQRKFLVCARRILIAVDANDCFLHCNVTSGPHEAMVLNCRRNIVQLELRLQCLEQSASVCREF